MISLWTVAILAALAAGNAGKDSSASVVDSTGVEIPTYTMPTVRTVAPRVVPVFPGTRTVLDREWLEFRDPADLAEAMVTVAGTRVLTAGDGVSRTVSIRGLGSDRTAVLIDGQLLNTAQGGGVDLSPLDVENLSRIEVARGAMGALYGPYALGGAVNLIRRSDRTPITSFRMLAGTEDRLSIHGIAGMGWSRWTVDGTFRLGTVSPDLNGTPSRSRGGGLQGRLAHHPGWASSLELNVDHRQGERDIPGSRDFPTPAAGQRDTYSVVTLAGRGIQSGPGILQARLTGSSMIRSYQDPQNPLGAIEDQHKNRRAAIDLGWKTMTVTRSLEFRAEGALDALDSTTDGVRQRNRAAGAVFGSVQGNRWDASVAFRWDAIEHFEPRPTIRVGMSRILSGSRAGGSSLRARFDVGTSFRPPTFDDLFWPARASAAGNPDLGSEHGGDLNLGLEFQTSSLTRVQVTAFTSRISDLIEWTPGADGVWRPHNVGEARLRGIELDGLWDMGTLPFRLEWAVNWLEAENATDDPVTGGKQLVGRARETAFAELSWLAGDLTLGAGVRGVSRVPLTSANTKWFDGYALMHGRARWRVSPTLRLDLEGRNLFDTPYEDLRGYATPGRELLLGFRYTPGAR